MAKQSYKARVTAAVVSYAKGSRKLVELFEEAAQGYWGADERRCDNLSCFLNAIKAFPVLQKAAVESTRTFGKFEISLKDGDVQIKNRGKVSDEQKAAFIKVVADYVAKEYNSLLAAHQNKLLDAFDLTKRMTGFESSATQLVVAALANDESLTQTQFVEQLQGLLAAIATKDLADKITEKRSEIAASKITPEQVQEAANAA
ncbi:hypothetical protein [Herbiconiux daphne]|uniref:Uncharacterized protein n=1 Tax=Herbiconiux daphne TaxID=2970914 RepID=A0ABT2HAI3_9MICO|nr:hypothetical protein [Herbiconiux daphne]MCS5736975.1 hypothetical protein [Herbiconiux daphne]